ncbi:MAG: hypothetical protein ACI4GV_02815 [Acutalibacteraceae bacterium]
MKFDFEAIIDKVSLVVNDFYLDNKTKCIITILKNNKSGYHAIIDLNNCVGEIVVDKPYCAPYRCVKMEVISMDSVDCEFVYAWYDYDGCEMDRITASIKLGLELALQHG